MSIARKANIYKSLFLALEHSRKIIKEELTKSLREAKLKITFDQWLLLSEIANFEEVNQKTLANNLCKEVASISRIVGKLERLQLLSREPNLYNRREVNLSLTDEGNKIIEKIEGFNDDKIKVLFSSVYEQELNLVTEVLCRLKQK